MGTRAGGKKTTVGRDEAVIRAYIRNQELEDRAWNR
jgi:hypothetical protein